MWALNRILLRESISCSAQDFGHITWTVCFCPDSFQSKNNLLFLFVFFFYYYFLCFCSLSIYCEKCAICFNLMVSFWREQFLCWEVRRIRKKKRVRRRVMEVCERGWSGKMWRGRCGRVSERWQGNFIVLTCMLSVKWIKCIFGADS